VMHWWAKSKSSLDQSFEAQTGSSAQQLTRFKYKSNVHEDPANRPNENNKLQAEALMWLVQSSSSQEESEMQTLEKMRESCEQGKGLWKLDERKLETQAAVMRAVVAKNFQKSDGKPVNAQDVALTLWWSRKENFKGLWAVGTLKELKEMLMFSVKSVTAITSEEHAAYEESARVRKALMLDENEPVSMRDNGEKIRFVQEGGWVPDGDAGSRAPPNYVEHEYDENDKTKIVLYLVGTGKQKKMIMTTKYEDFTAEREFLEGKDFVLPG